MMPYFYRMMFTGVDKNIELNNNCKYCGAGITNNIECCNRCGAPNKNYLNT
jgi:predicted amidophosphoribosyltransferase